MRVKSPVIFSKISSLLSAFDDIQAYGLSGSSAAEAHDDLSDLDVCVFTPGAIPPVECRKAQYLTAGVETIEHLDVDFEVSRGDGVRIAGCPVDFIWMEVNAIRAFLSALTVDFACDEFLPGGLLKIQALYDPGQVIASLQQQVPPYPRPRAAARVASHIAAAHFALYSQRWMEKAVSRQDAFSFIKYEYELLDHFFSALFALNQRWFCVEKRLTRLVREFPLVPERAGERIEAIILRQGENASLEGCLKNYQQLCVELVALACQQYPECELTCFIPPRRE